MKTTIIIAVLTGVAISPIAEAQVKREKRFERLDNRTDRLERRGAWDQGSYADYAEDRFDRFKDRFDRFEDRIDRRESRRDEAVDFGRRDVIEDRWDRTENVFDRRENRWDRRRD